MKKPSTLSRPTWLLPARTTIKALAAPAVASLALLWVAGCASNTNSDVLIDPLKQRLLAREDIALQNLLFARTPAYSYAGSGGGSYLDAPYDGPAVEPPLPDLNLLPEDMPPWEELEPLPPVPGSAAAASPTPEPAPQPTPAEQGPMEAEASSSTPSES